MPAGGTSTERGACRLSFQGILEFEGATCTRGCCGRGCASSPKSPSGRRRWPIRYPIRRRGGPRNAVDPVRALAHQRPVAQALQPERGFGCAASLGGRPGAHIWLWSKRPACASCAAMRWRRSIATSSSSRNRLIRSQCRCRRASAGRARCRAQWCFRAPVSASPRMSVEAVQGAVLHWAFARPHRAAHAVSHSWGRHSQGRTGFARFLPGQPVPLQCRRTRAPGPARRKQHR